MARQLKQVTLATELYAIDKQIAEIAAQLKPLEDRKEGIRTALLENLRQQGVKNLKLENGTSYIRAFKTTLKVSDEGQAFSWAERNNSLKVDTAKAMKILKLTGMTDKLPDGFERTDTEYLQVRSGKEADEVRG